MTSARLVTALVLLASACSTAPRGAPGPAPDAAVPGPPMVAEASFTDVPPQVHGAPYAARMFSVFHPADADAEHAPLLVFFNGGPGSATSLGLLAYGTGPMTLDPADIERTVPGGPADAGPSDIAPAPVIARPNPRAFTRFASTLYVDERQTGFSYGLRPEGVGPTACTFSPMDDALDYVRALLAFFDAHEALRHVPLVLVGESYGGTRAMAILDALLRYRDAALPEDLAVALQSHLDRVFPATVGVHPVEEIASRLRAVLIEPLVMGELQQDVQRRIIDADPYAGRGAPFPGEYDVRKPADYSDRVFAQAARALSAPDTARMLLGVELTSIARLAPPGRGDAFRPVGGYTDAPSERALEAALGPLGEGDAYLEGFAPQCYGQQIDLQAPNRFASALYDVPLFITHARYDAVIYTPAIPRTLQDQGWPVTVDDGPRPGVARPGWFKVTVPESGPATARRPSKTVEVRFPLYDDSGHEVTFAQGGDLADDVAAWLATVPAPAAPPAH